MWGEVVFFEKQFGYVQVLTHVVGQIRDPHAASFDAEKVEPHLNYEGLK